mmetsp:Transcript_20099/g.68134  ORF Transcript_20099/g.68134 Transcript_20099/m.68134 type:complete len:286 (+) Transcript_20099:140-997(+)
MGARLASQPPLGPLQSRLSRRRHGAKASSPHPRRGPFPAGSAPPLPPQPREEPGHAGALAAPTRDEPHGVLEPALGGGVGLHRREVHLAALLIAVDGLRHLGELDPPVLRRADSGSLGHDERREAVLAAARCRLVVLNGVDKGIGLALVGLLVAAHEEIEGQVGVAREVREVEARRVGVLIVRLAHALGPQHLRALVVAVRRLAAHVDHGLAAVLVPDEHRCRVKGLGALELLDLLVDHAAAGGHDLERLAAHEEAGHVQVVHGHVLEDAATALDVLEGGRGRVA